jgi:hypothetical protein
MPERYFRRSKPREVYPPTMLITFRTVEGRRWT